MEIVCDHLSDVKNVATVKGVVDATKDCSIIMLCEVTWPSRLRKHPSALEWAGGAKSREVWGKSINVPPSKYKTAHVSDSSSRSLTCQQLLMCYVLNKRLICVKWSFVSFHDLTLNNRPHNSKGLVWLRIDLLTPFKPTYSGNLVWDRESWAVLTVRSEPEPHLRLERHCGHSK